MFSRKPNIKIDVNFNTPSEPLKPKESEIEKAIREVNEEAEAMVPAIKAEQAARLESFKNDHRIDSLDYKFRCERYGDYLAFFVERGRKFIVAVALKDVDVITAIDGTLPSLNGSAGFDSNARVSAYGYGCERSVHRSAPVRSRQPLLTSEKPIFDDKIISRCWIPDTHGYWIPIKGHIDGLAVPAEDDRIAFNGHTLYVPTGRGEEVHALILKAIKKGYQTPVMGKL